MNKDKIKEEFEKEVITQIVNRFLGWKLPLDFQPDAGISFKKTFNEGTEYPMKHEPVGTNLFTAQQAEEMVRYILADSLFAHLSAQYEKLIEEVIGEEEEHYDSALSCCDIIHGECTCGATDRNALRHSIRTSLQERGIKIK